LNAKVTITDISRNQDYKAETNSSGVYASSSLPPASIASPPKPTGFRTYVLDSLQLSTQQNATVNIKLEIGAVSEKVQVTATGALLETSPPP